MSKISRRIRRIVVAAAALVAVLTMTVSTVSAEVVDRIVAQVNDEIITLYELEQAAIPYLAQFGQSPQVLQQEERRDEILKDVLDEKIDSILVEQEAQEQGLQVAEEQIEQWVAQTAQQQGMTPQQFRQAIAQYGIEYDEYREIIRDQLRRMQLMQGQMRGGAVSQSDVEEAYRDQFGEPDGYQEEIQARHILVVPDQIDGGEEAALQLAAQLREQIVAGEADFAELAEAHSQGPGADDGGSLGTFTRGTFARSFEDAAFDLAVGEVSEPVRTEFGIHLIEVMDRQRIEDPQVEQRKEQLRAQLQQQEMERQMESYLETLRTRAFVDVRF